MHETHVCASEGIGLQVSEVSSMSLLAQWTAMTLVFGVEMLANMVSWVSILVDMHSVFAIRVQALNRAYYFDWRLNGILTEGRKTHYLRVQGVKNANSVSPCIDFLRAIEQKRRKSQREKASCFSHIINRYLNQFRSVYSLPQTLFMFHYKEVCPVIFLLIIDGSDQCPSLPTCISNSVILLCRPSNCCCRAVFSPFKEVICCCILLFSAFWKLKCLFLNQPNPYISSSIRTSSFERLFLTSAVFMVRTDSRVSFSLRRICTYFL